MNDLYVYEDELDEESDGPEEGDITTDDHCRFYQDGKLVLDLDPEGDHIKELREHMNRGQYWPNVWFISDHGNAHLIDMNEKPS